MPTMTQSMTDEALAAAKAELNRMMGKMTLDEFEDLMWTAFNWFRLIDGFDPDKVYILMNPLAAVHAEDTFKIEDRTIRRYWNRMRNFKDMAEGLHVTKLIQGLTADPFWVKIVDNGAVPKEFHGMRVRMAMMSDNVATDRLAADGCFAALLANNGTAMGRFIRDDKF